MTIRERLKDVNLYVTGYVGEHSWTIKRYEHYANGDEVKEKEDIYLLYVDNDEGTEMLGTYSSCMMFLDGWSYGLGIQKSFYSEGDTKC